MYKHLMYNNVIIAHFLQISYFQWIIGQIWIFHQKGLSFRKSPVLYICCIKIQDPSNKSFLEMYFF